MMTSSRGNTFCITSPLWRESWVTGGYPSQRGGNVMLWCSPVFILNKVLNKLEWLETPQSAYAWCHCNVITHLISLSYCSGMGVTKTTPSVLSSEEQEKSWWHHKMETFSVLLANFAGDSQRPVTRSYDVFFYLRLNKRLSKQSWGWWFETLSRPLWRHCNVNPTPGT